MDDATARRIVTESLPWCTDRNAYADPEVCPPGDVHLHYMVEVDVATGRVFTDAAGQEARRKVAEHRRCQVCNPAGPGGNLRHTCEAFNGLTPADLDHDREITTYRTMLADNLRSALNAVSLARGALSHLRDPYLFDVEVAEGDAGHVIDAALTNAMIGLSAAMHRAPEATQ